MLGRRLDVLAHNRLAGALITEFRALPARQRNQARFVFFDPHARELYADWATVAADTVAMLRLDAGRYPDDSQLSALIGELSIHSEEFRKWWSDHKVHQRTTGTNAYHHPLVGDLTIEYPGPASRRRRGPDPVRLHHATGLGLGDLVAAAGPLA